jgi:HEAT repeat protein
VTLSDSNKYVRGGEAEALGKLGSSQAVESLMALLSDSDESVRTFADKALFTIRWKSGIK